LQGKNPQKRGFDYTYVIVGCMFLMIFVTLGFCSSSRSLYLSPITEALGIKRSLFSIGDSLRYISTAVVNIFFGALLQKFGTRKLLGAGFLSLIITMLCYSFAENVVGFYVGGVFLGLGLAWTTTTMIGSIVSRWCKGNRGTVMGMVLAANGVGSALATQIVTPIIYEAGNPFGYRNAYKLIAVILAVTGVIILSLYREKPTENGEKSAVKTKKKSRGVSWTGVSMAEARQKSYFYLALGCIFATGLVLQGITSVAAAHMKDVGLEAAYVATVLSVHSLALSGFKFLMGFLYDRLGLRTTMTICDVASLIVMVLLASITASPLGKVLAIAYGVLSSAALPLETIMLPLYAGDLFGEKEFNKFLGLVVSINTAGYALGSPIFNAVFDKTGSYDSIFFVCAGIMATVTVVTQIVITSAQKERKKLMEAEKQLCNPETV